MGEEEEKDEKEEEHINLISQCYCKTQNKNLCDYLLLHLTVAGCNLVITSVKRRSNAFKSENEYLIGIEMSWV